MKLAFSRNAFVQFTGMFDVIFKFTVALRYISRSPHKFRAGHKACEVEYIRPWAEDGLWGRLLV